MSLRDDIVRERKYIKALKMEQNDAGERLAHAQSVLENLENEELTCAMKRAYDKYYSGCEVEWYGRKGVVVKIEPVKANDTTPAWANMYVKIDTPVGGIKEFNFRADDPMLKPVKNITTERGRLESEWMCRYGITPEQVASNRFLRQWMNHCIDNPVEPPPPLTYPGAKILRALQESDVTKDALDELRVILDALEKADKVKNAIVSMTRLSPVVAKDRLGELFKLAGEYSKARERTGKCD